MKLQIRIAGLLSFLFFMLISCKKEECNDITFPDQNLEAVSLEYQPHQGVQAFIYKDSIGQEYRYELYMNTEFVSSNFRIDTGDEHAYTISYRYQYSIKSFRSANDTRIAYARVIDFVEDETVFQEKNLVDRIGITVFDDTSVIPSGVISRLILMTSSRESNIDQAVYNNENSILHPTITIFGETFLNVFELKLGAPKIYFTKDHGVVSFTDNSGRRMVLDRIE